MAAKARAESAVDRYGSVDALIRDLERFEQGRPLEARGNHWGYRAGRFVRRNWRLVSSLAALAALAAGLTVYFTLGLIRARRAAVMAEARTELEQQFLLDMFGGADKDAAPSRGLGATELLDRAAEEAGALGAEPETQGQLYLTLGSAYRKLGELDKAEKALRASIGRLRAMAGARDARVVEGWNELALVNEERAHFGEAEREAREAVKASAGVAGDEAASIRAQAVLGRVWADEGKSEDAIRLLEPVVKGRAEGDQQRRAMIDALRSMARAQQDANHYQDSQDTVRRAMELTRRIYGGRHPLIGEELSDLASAEATLGRLSEAEALYRQVLEISKNWYGASHPETAITANILAMVLVQEGKVSEAEPLMKGVLDVQEKNFGMNHPYVAAAADTLGRIAMSRGERGEAGKYFEQALNSDRAALGEKNHQTAVVEAHWAQLLASEGDYTRAEALLRAAVKTLAAGAKEGNVSSGMVRLALGRVQVKEGKRREAEANLEAGYRTLAVQTAPAYERARAQAKRDLLELYAALGESAKAMALNATEASKH